jgi:hypothetical protein
MNACILRTEWIYPLRPLNNVESRRRQPKGRYGGHGSAAPNNGIFAYPFFGLLIEHAA